MGTGVMMGQMAVKQSGGGKQQDRDENRCYSTYVFSAKHDKESNANNS
jgi:hypothetical protein